MNIFQQAFAEVSPDIDLAFIQWETIDGTRYEGFLIDIEEGVGTVLCADGVKRAVELDE